MPHPVVRPSSHRTPIAISCTEPSSPPNGLLLETLSGGYIARNRKDAHSALVMAASGQDDLSPLSVVIPGAARALRLLREPTRCRRRTSRCSDEMRSNMRAVNDANCALVIESSGQRVGGQRHRH